MIKGTEDRQSNTETPRELARKKTEPFKKWFESQTVNY